MQLIEACDSDRELVLAWRNNPLCMAGCYTQGFGNPHPITWEEHAAWWSSRRNWKEFIIEYKGRKIGVLTIGQLDYWEPEIGIVIGETTLWGLGLGKMALERACDYLRECGRKYTRTTILDNNKRSIKLFEGVGYKKIAPARPGESLYRKVL